MKKLFVLLTISLVLANASYAGNDNDSDGTKVSLWIPGFLVKIAANVADDYTDEVDMNIIKKIGNVNVFVREGDAYRGNYDKKAIRKINRLERKNYTQLLTVREDETNINIQIKENRKGTIKRLAVLVDDRDETFVFLKINCKLKPEDISNLVSNYM